MSRKMLAALAAGWLALGVTAQAAAQAPAAAPEKNDYAAPANWLCWPGRADACSGDNTATVIKADGTMTKETWKPDPKAAIDCFYVYPTVSNDKSVLSDMIPNDEEHRVVEQQLNRFASKCRVYAPMYRQFTLTALRAMITGQPLPGGMAANAPRPDTGYTDVVDAWTYYLAHENKGRGVVLIGHSQGSGVLTRLLAAEIDGKPSQKLLVSAILGGTGLPVEPGKDTGLLKSIPTCKSAGQTGCVIAFASFRDNVPPPANSRFGRPREAGSKMEVACVNPASLAGGPGELHAYLSTTGNGMDPAAWVKGGPKVETPFVSVPGLLTGQCVSKNGFNYLEVHVNADPADPRTDVIKGDVMLGPDKVSEDWGLHLIDMNLTMGDMVSIVGSEAKAWTSKK
jgi:pimeloyl-ACP methyl ester carboxylesterase